MLGLTSFGCEERKVKILSQELLNQIQRLLPQFYWTRSLGVVNCKGTYDVKFSKNAARLVFDDFMAVRLISETKRKHSWGLRRVFHYHELTSKGNRMLLTFVSRKGIHASHFDSIRGLNNFTGPDELTNMGNPKDEALHPNLAVSTLKNFVSHLKLKSEEKDIESENSIFSHRYGSAIWDSRVQSAETCTFRFTGERILLWLMEAFEIIGFHEAVQVVNTLVLEDLIMVIQTPPNDSFERTIVQRYEETIYILTDRVNFLIGAS